MLLMSVLLAGAALAADGQESFRAGITAFQKADYASARAAFSESLKSEPQNPVIIYDLGLTEYRAGNKGLGIGLWRKALTIAPDYPPAAHAVKWIDKQLQHGNADTGLWEDFRDAVLVDTRLSHCLFLTALLSLISGWALLKYFGDRRRALLDEKPLPTFSVISGIFCGLLLISIGLSLAKSIDLSTVRGTIVPDKVAVQSTADKDSATLFDLFGGLEVIVRQSKGDWLMISQPGGLSGWVPKDAVFISSSARIDR